MPRLKLWLLAVVLAAGFLLSVAMCARAETVEIELVCQPSHVGVAFLRSLGMATVDAWVSDQGFPVEVWSDGRQGRALMVLLQDDAGHLLRCLLLPRTPEGQGS